MIVMSHLGADVAARATQPARLLTSPGNGRPRPTVRASAMRTRVRSQAASTASRSGVPMAMRQAISDEQRAAGAVRRRPFDAAALDDQVAVSRRPARRRVALDVAALGQHRLRAPRLRRS